MKSIVILLVFVLTSCQFVRLSKAVDRQNIEISSTPTSFELKNNRILLNNGIGFCIDIGAPNVIFSSKDKRFNIIDSITIGSLTDVNGRNIENKNFIIEEIKNPFFIVKKGVFKSLDRDLKCSDMNGLIGCELFQNKIIGLDFQKNEIKNLSFDFDFSDYKQAEIADFDGYYFIIKLKINNQIILAKLDTGNPYDLILKKDDYQKVKSQEYLSFFGSREKIDTLYNSINSIEIGNSSSNEILIKSNKYIKRNLIGVGFMKNYNWIIDFKKGKVYYKKIKENHLELATNKVTINNDKIIYSQSNNSKQLRIDLGDEIIIINNQKVTPENICEMQALLNKTEDWGTLKLEVIPGKS